DERALHHRRLHVLLASRRRRQAADRTAAHRSARLCHRCHALPRVLRHRPDDDEHSGGAELLSHPRSALARHRRRTVLRRGSAWAGGELPLLRVVIVLAVHWTKQDKRDARRFDRHEDAGLSDEFSAYNDMLRKLAERDGVVAADSESDAAADSVASSADSS